MPMYTYYCYGCDLSMEHVVPIDLRDDYWCQFCELKLERKIDKPGMVWSPTKSGGNHS